MKTKSRAIVLAIACFCCLITACSALSVDADVLQYELFDFSDSYASTNVSVPAGTGITVADRGLGITAGKSGANVSIKNTLGGVFDISFMPYSTLPYAGNVLEGSSFDNSYQDIEEMSLVFTDAKDSSKSFKVRLTGGAADNNVTVNASVDTGAYRAGVYYYRDNKASGSTSGYNAEGVYTYLYGTSFSNMAVSDGSYASSNVRPVRIVFDPDEMCVYGYNYGYNAYTAEKRLIWDMSESIVDGRDVEGTLQGFSEYKVKLVFDSVRSGKKASTIIYSINGQSLASSVVNNLVGPTLKVDADREISVGSTLTVPQPYAYDFIDGKVSFDGVVRVTDPDGNVVVPEVAGVSLTLSSEKPGYYTYVDGAEIDIVKDGSYLVSYIGKDSDGIYGIPYEAVFKTAEEEDGLIIEGSYSSYVRVGSNLNIPSAKWNIDGSDVAADAKVISPDGEILSSPYQASVAGRYTIVYSASHSASTLESNLYIYAFEDNSSLFGVGNGVSVSSGTSPLNVGLSGLIATTTVANGTVTYSKAIDISSKTKSDTIISFMALPRSIGKASMGQIAVKLTDSADASNYVNILITPATSKDMSMVRAGSAEQTPAGRSSSGSVESYLGGGTGVLHSFYGIANYVDITEQIIDVRMDYATKCVYIGEKLVCDLDDSEYFAKAWDGFKGQAILSVTMRELASESASILINSVDGNKIYGSYYGDCVSPTIFADFDVDDVPDAEVGKKYSILPVTVRDNRDTEASVTVKVTDKDGKSVAINDGGFVPTEEGEYYMTFAASDCAGNTVSVRYTVNAYSSVSAPSISIDGVVPSATYVGEKISLPSYLVSGGSGMNRVVIKAVGKSTGTEYTVENLTFVALVADVYTVTYTVTDYLGTSSSASGTVAATVSDRPIWKSTLVLPDVLVSGQKVILPSASAYDYVANRPATISVAVNVDGKSVAIGSDLVYNPTTNLAKTTATVVYTATAASGKTSVMEYEIPLVNLYDEYGLVISRYFKTEGINQVKQEEDYISFGFTSSDNSIEFVKPVYAHGFELVFDVPVGANNFNTVSITLTDVLDASKKVIFTARKGGFADKTTFVSINDMQDISIEGNFFDAIKRMRISYNNDDYSIQDSSGLTVGYVKNYSDGSRFQGFSDTVYMSISMDGVDGLGQLNLYKLGNQLLMENDGDYTQPVIVTEEEISRSLSKGSLLVIPKAKAFDVLGFSTTISVSVLKNNTRILSDAAADVSHTVELNEYGEYTVIYKAYDDCDNPATLTLVVNVRDNEPPTIGIEQEELVVYVGTEVTIPVPIVVDDVSVDKQYVFVIDTLNNMINVTGETTYTPTKKGIYTIRYVAIDSSGNYGIKDLILKVAEVKNEEIA